MKKALTICAAALAFAACTDQRDLYVAVSPNIQVDGDWNPSLGRTDMTMDATVIAYDASGLYAKEYFFDPRTATVAVDKGVYDILLFNGLMYAPEDTHLDGIYFRGTEGFGTFEAVAQMAEPNKRLGRADGEYIATNNMEIFTSATEHRDIETAKEYFIKYKNGKNGFDIPESYTEAELGLTPQAMNYPCQVTVTIANITSAYAANGAVYGFAGSAFAASRRPSNFMATHQFNLNNKRILSADDDTGTIESPAFVTFGPPLDMAGKTCSVYINIMLTNGVPFEQEFDVTGQILPFVESVKNNLAGTGDVQYRLEIPIHIELELPVVEPIDGQIGLGDWDDDEIITVPIKP